MIQSCCCRWQTIKLLMLRLSPRLDARPRCQELIIGNNCSFYFTQLFSYTINFFLRMVDRSIDRR
jgi:hypothetical protein